MVTISDVAREAGVSTATVSRALNDSSRIRPEYAARVHAAVEKLNYRPSAIARGLRRQKTDVLALIVSDVANPFFTAIARGVEDVAQANDHSVLLCNSDEDPAKEARYLSVAEAQRVAGVVLSPHSAATDVSPLRGAGVPLVVVDRLLSEPADSVVVRSSEGAAVATRHLLEQGWRRPACVTGPRDAATALERLEGYRLALAKAGVGEGRAVHESFSERGGAEGTARLLESDSPPDSFFVANAQMALGVIAELKRRGLKIGHDIGVISFDDAPWAPLIEPSLSVIAQPAYEIGAMAGRLLMDRISGTVADAPRNVVLSTSLVVRDSSLRR